MFDRDTVARIPTMDAAARKILQDRNKAAAALNVAPEVASPRATFRTFLDQLLPRRYRCALSAA